MRSKWFRIFILSTLLIGWIEIVGQEITFRTDVIQNAFVKKSYQLTPKKSPYQIQNEFQKIGIRDGLLHEGIFSVAEDSDGRLIVGIGDECFYRWDGYKFENLKNVYGIIGFHGLQYFEDSRGRMWFVTDLGITIFDKKDPINGYHIIPIPDRSWYDEFIEVCEMPQGNFIMITKHYGLFDIIGDTAIASIDIPAFGSKMFRGYGVKSIDDGTLYIEGEPGVFSLLDKKLDTICLTDENELVDIVENTKDDSLMLANGRNGGIYSLKKSKIELINQAPDYINLGCSDATLYRNRVIVSRPGGPPVSISLEPGGEYTVLMKKQMNNAFVDSHGTLWFGSHTAGLFRYKKQFIRDLNGDKLDDGEEIRFFDNVKGSNDIVVGSRKGLYLVDIDGVRTLKFNWPFSVKGRINGVQRGKWLIGVVSESAGDENLLLFRFNIESYQLESYDLNRQRTLKFENLTDLNALANSLWVLNKNKLFEVDFDRNILTIRRFAKTIGFESIEFDHDSFPIVVIRENYAVKIYPDSAVRIYAGIANNGINDILVDKNAQAWFATWGGLHVMQTTQDTAQAVGGLPTWQIYSLAENDSNTLWVGSSKGISMVSKKRVMSMFNITSVVYPIVNQIDMESIKPVSKNQALFSSSEGFFLINTDERHQPHVPAPVVLSDVIINEKSIRIGYKRNIKEVIASDSGERTTLKPITDGIKLGSNENSIQFNFSSPEFVDKQYINYSYSMDGLTGKWIDNGHIRTLKFNHLNNGKYTLHIKAYHAHNSQLESSVTSFSFEVLPAYWQTWWFKSLEGLGLLFVIMGIVYIRNRSVAREQKVTQQKIETATAALTKDKVVLENVQVELEAQKEELQKASDKLAKKNMKLWETSIAVHKEKEKVEIAKAQIEQKHRDVQESIEYAESIQSAILPSINVVRKHLPESFILYKPKDIIAGDFYWIETGIGLDDENVYFSAADCTGHGVPGAMMSVMCSNALTIAVKELGLTQPGKILDETTKLIESRFERSERRVLDGMDLALCKLNRATNILDYAGANNPLWIVRNGIVLETRADRQPIGQYDYRTPYTNHEVQLIKDDVIYIFSDGYVDQFGGDKSKKFKAKPFKELLLSIQKYDFDEHQKILDDAFISWKGDHEQVDDVCIIGVKI